MPPTARDHSELHHAVIERLLQCAPVGAEPAVWIARQVRMDQDHVAALLAGTVGMSVDAADELLRACCGEDLLTAAGRAYGNEGP